MFKVNNKDIRTTPKWSVLRKQITARDRYHIETRPLICSHIRNEYREIRSIVNFEHANTGWDIEWGKAFKSGLSNFLKAVFHKIYLLHS